MTSSVRINYIRCAASIWALCESAIELRTVLLQRNNLDSRMQPRRVSGPIGPERGVAKPDMHPVSQVVGSEGKCQGRDALCA